MKYIEETRALAIDARELKDQIAQAYVQLAHTLFNFKTLQMNEAGSDRHTQAINVLTGILTKAGITMLDDVEAAAESYIEGLRCSLEEWIEHAFGAIHGGYVAHYRAAISTLNDQTGQFTSQLDEQQSTIMELSKHNLLYPSREDMGKITERIRSYADHHPTTFGLEQVEQPLPLEEAVVCTMLENGSLVDHGFNTVIEVKRTVLPSDALDQCVDRIAENFSVEASRETFRRMVDAAEIISSGTNTASALHHVDELAKEFSIFDTLSSYLVAQTLLCSRIVGIPE